MNENALKNINNIPVRTWRWLGVNNISLDSTFPEVKPYKLDIIKDNSQEGLSVISMDKKNSNSLRLLHAMDYDGVGKELTDQVKNSYNSGFFIETAPHKKFEVPVLINYDFDAENNVVVDDNIIIAEQGSEITVVVRYNSKDNLQFFHNGFTRIYCKKGATVNIVKIQTLSGESTHLDANIAKVEEGGTINYVLIELGARNSITNFRTDLEGYKSVANMHNVYIGDKERNIDINYLINHYGKETKSSIEARGALMDNSKKIFKGTLDFKKGASKSKGKEVEYTVLLSPKVRNRSVPVLLCTEDDVEGQHAASAGKIDENKLFYLMTRGFTEKEAKKLIIEASIGPIIDMIPEKTAKEEIYEYIRRKLINE